MTPPRIHKFLAVLLPLILVSVTGYTYDEILHLNATCFPKDTCSVPRDLDDPEQHNCDCSSLCTLYDTCCIDSPFLNITIHFDRTASCLSSTGHQDDEHVFMVDTCSESFRGPSEIRRRCEGNDKHWSDPLNNVPATHLPTQKTYKSIFCALCDGQDPGELVLWHVMVDCSTLRGGMGLCDEKRRFVLNNMMFVEDKGMWGLWSYDPDTDWMFRRLNLSYRMPDRVKKFVKICRPDVVSRCPPDWQDVRVEELCHIYMGVVYFENETYRNVHCAMCNDVLDFREASCHSVEGTSFRGTGMNFGVLLDFDLSDGDRVGNVENRCGRNEMYDPFGKKCRKIECPLPGYTLKDKKCVPQ